MVFSVGIDTRNRGRVCLFLKSFEKRKRRILFFYQKDDNGEFWVEVLIVTFLDVVATP